jgi:hypothetical protein
VTDPNGRPTTVNGFAHLSDADLAGYLDHDLTSDERRRIETHIDQCATCRAELVALSRVVHGDSREQRRPGLARRWWIPAVAAAAVVALLAPHLTTRPSEVDTAPRTRRVIDADGRPRLEIVSPGDGATSGGRLVFTWRAASADGYRIVVLTESADPVWTTDTGDTTVALPESVSLQPGHAYFWRVDAIGNGIAATTGNHRFEIPDR